MTRSERKAQFKQRRIELMISSYLDEHKTLQEIGDEWNVTRERVRQIIVQHGGFVPGEVRFKRYELARTQKRAAYEIDKADRDLKKHGMTSEAIKQLSPLRRTDEAHPLALYRRWRQNIRTQHGVKAIGLTFAEWWKIWQDSGHWGERGRGHGHWMARRDTSKPWTPDNIHIAAGAAVAAASYIAHPAAERSVKAVKTKRERYGLGLMTKKGRRKYKAKGFAGAQWHKVNTCVCGAQVKGNVGFWRHKQACLSVYRDQQRIKEHHNNDNDRAEKSST